MTASKIAGVVSQLPSSTSCSKTPATSIYCGHAWKLSQYIVGYRPFERASKHIPGAHPPETLAPWLLSPVTRSSIMRL